MNSAKDQANMTEDSPESSSTVDEIVDSLVQEIDNELIHTLEDVNRKEDNKRQMYQIPLQDIGEETMDMIVTYNTRVNSNLAIASSSSLNKAQNGKENYNHGIEEDKRIYGTDNQDDMKTNDFPDLENSYNSDSDMDISEVDFSPIKRNNANLPVQSQTSILQQNVDEVTQNTKILPKIENNCELSNNEELYGIGILNLPALPEVKPMFRNSSLAKMLDNSIDSDTQEMSRNMDYKPKDFLSIWHLQEEEASTASALSSVLSNNSQFTRYTNSTNVSSPPVTKSPQNRAIFKFKPRIVSQSRIYSPRSNFSNRLSWGVYSMVSSESVGQEDDDIYNNSIIQPDQKLINPNNLPVEEKQLVEKMKLSSSSSLNLSVKQNISINDHENIEKDLDLDFNDIMNRLDHLGKDSLIEDSIVTNNRENDVGTDHTISDHTPSLTGKNSAECDILLERNHISSPFKVRNAVNKEPIEESSTVSVKQEDSVSLNNDIQSESLVEKCAVPLKDNGVIFVKINNLQNFRIDGAKQRNAAFCLEVKQGNKVILTTEWIQIKNNKNIPLMENFSFILDEGFRSFGNNKLQFMIKLKYDRITKQTIEVVKKVPVGKKFPFVKTKYVYETAFIDKPIEKDPWSDIVDSQGKFAICDIILDDLLLEESKFNRMEKTLKLVKEFSNTPAIPYSVGQINVEFLYVARSTNNEMIPLQLNKVDKIMSKYTYQHNIHVEGYLLQEGADVVAGSCQRRYFELNGSTLVAYHESTKNPVIVINLLNVEKITSSYDDDDNGQVQKDRNFTNLTDIMLFGEHIRLHFFDKETITFTTDVDHESMQQWYKSLQEVVVLNASHQPWVKMLCKQ